MTRVLLLLALLISLSNGAAAEAPASSIRPEHRERAVIGQIESRTAAVRQVVAADALSGPRARPLRAPISPVVRQVSAVAGLQISPRPEARPENLRRRSVVRASGVRTQPAATVRSGQIRGNLCGMPGVEGAPLAAIPGRLSGCGVANPVKVTAIDGVRFSTPATMTCEAAGATQAWLRLGAMPAVGRLGGGIEAIKVAAHYSCRTRNNQPGAKISEHGRGKAIDISATRLRNGVEMTVLKGWNDPAQGRVLRKMHEAACGPYTTVLGPDADRYHKDHFHFDVASRRTEGSTYCR